MKSNFLFLYGTLMAKYPGNPFRLELEKYATYVAEGQIQGSLYGIEDYPGVVLNSRGIVHGEIWKVHDLDKLFEILDPYEGFDPCFPFQGEYERRVVTVQTHNLQPVRSWVYVYRGDVLMKKIIPSGHFMDTLL